MSDIVDNPSEREHMGFFLSGDFNIKGFPIFQHRIWSEDIPRSKSTDNVLTILSIFYAP